MAVHIHEMGPGKQPLLSSVYDFQQAIDETLPPSPLWPVVVSTSVGQGEHAGRGREQSLHPAGKPLVHGKWVMVLQTIEARLKPYRAPIVVPLMAQF
jgi:hypothetical protein